MKKVIEAFSHEYRTNFPGLLADCVLFGVIIGVGWQGFSTVAKHVTLFIHSQLI